MLRSLNRLHRLALARQFHTSASVHTAAVFGSSAPAVRKVAFLGAGGIAPFHYKALTKLGGRVKLHGIYSTDSPEHLKQVAKSFGDAHVYRSADELISDPTTDSVFVLTPVETHAELAERVMRDGKKHVLVEKPVASDWKEISRLQIVSDETKRICFPVHNYVYEPSLIRAKEMIDSDELGAITHISIQYHIHHPENIAVRYPGVIKQILTHHSYLLLYLTGGEAPAKLSCFGSICDYRDIQDKEQQASVMLAMPSQSAIEKRTRFNGCLVNFVANWAADDVAGDPFLVKIIGTKGGTRFSYRDWVSTVRRGPFQIHSAWYEAYPASIEGTVQRFIECTTSGSTVRPLSTLRDAITAAHIVDSCTISARDNTVIDLSIL